MRLLVAWRSILEAVARHLSSEDTDIDGNIGDEEQEYIEAEPYVVREQLETEVRRDVAERLDAKAERLEQTDRPATSTGKIAQEVHIENLRSRIFRNLQAFSIATWKLTVETVLDWIKNP